MMTRYDCRRWCAWLVSGCVACAAAPSNAQTTVKRGAQGGNRANESDVERGRITGRLTSYRKITGSSTKTAILTIEMENRRSTTISLRETTSMQVRHTDITGKKAAPFLVTGVMVDADWTELRTPAAGYDGRFADRIEIHAEEIQGTLQSITDSGTTVLAEPRKKTDYEREYEGGGDTRLRVEGRETRKEQPRRTEPPPSPKRLALTFAKDATMVSLEGKSTKIADVVKAAKDKTKKFRFEAVVVAGGGNRVAELHMREGAEKQDDYAKKGNRRPSKASK